MARTGFSGVAVHVAQVPFAVMRDAMVCDRIGVLACYSACVGSCEFRIFCVDRCLVVAWKSRSTVTVEMSRDMNIHTTHINMTKALSI